jgi:hypothetical protein
VGRACGTHGRGEKRVQGFGGKAGRKTTTWKTKASMVGWDQNGYYGGWLGGVVDWIHLAQDRYLWRALVNVVMNLQVLAPRN